ncbi:MAG TPA: HEAT repeat domain-containing protein, partial [Planctomycetaceae bacterium]
PGVMRLLFEFAAEPYPPRCVFDALKARDDPEFVAALLRWFPAEPSPTLAANFRQIDVVPWLRTPERIADVPEALQGRLPAFILATGLPESRKRELEEWLVRHGSAAGRRGAEQVLDRLDLETIRQILLESLDSEDEDVSAWATSQLRPRHVPGAFRLLIDRLDSASEVVREAAREQLRGFTIEQLLAIHDRLPPELCLRAGRLVRKVDPDSPAKLAAMIAGPVQRQRIAAAQAAGRLGMADDVRPALLGLLADEDAALRRVGVEALAGDPSPEVLTALRDLAADPSPRVRQAAARALADAGISAEIPSVTAS